MKYKICRLFYLVIFLLSLINCGQSNRSVIKKDYNFHKIRKILVIKFTAPQKYRNEGNAVADIFSFKLLEKGLNVMGREVTGDEENFDVILKKAREYNIDAIITGSVFKYELEQKIHSLKKSEKKVKVTSSSNVKVSIKEEENELVSSVGQMHGASVNFPYEIDAAVGIIAKMIDVESGDIIWSARDETSRATINLATESAVENLIDSMPEPFTTD